MPSLLGCRHSKQVEIRSQPKGYLSILTTRCAWVAIHKRGLLTRLYKIARQRENAWDSKYLWLVFQDTAALLGRITAGWLSFSLPCMRNSRIIACIWGLHDWRTVRKVFLCHVLVTNELLQALALDSWRPGLACGCRINFWQIGCSIKYHLINYRIIFDQLLLSSIQLAQIVD